MRIISYRTLGLGTADADLHRRGSFLGSGWGVEMAVALGGELLDLFPKRRERLSSSVLPTPPRSMVDANQLGGAFLSETQAFAQGLQVQHRRGVCACSMALVKNYIWHRITHFAFFFCKTSRMRASMTGCGRHFPVSHRDQVTNEQPTNRDACSCVSPRFWRKALRSRGFPFALGFFIG